MSISTAELAGKLGDAAAVIADRIIAGGETGAEDLEQLAGAVWNLCNEMRQLLTIATLPTEEG